jgi:hypothetical protein
MPEICSLLAVIIGFAFQNDMLAEAKRRAAEHRQQSIQINELAAHINSEADSEKLVSQVAEIFKDELPPAWATRQVRSRLAHEEFKAATDTSSLIPDERLAKVWNHYVHEIGAPDETVVTVEEVHNLRDAQYATSQMLWQRDSNHYVWTMPNIVAVASDGKIANGCRPLEAIRVIYTMRSLFDNVLAARKRVREGQLLSDELANKPKSQPSEQKVTVMVVPDTNPIRPAEQNYVREHGSVAFNGLLVELFSELFPDEQLQQR